MQPNVISRSTAFIIILAELVAFIVLLPREGSTQSNALELSQHASSLGEQEQRHSGFPVRLKIPGIDVDSSIEQVGLTSDGAMDIPKSQGDVAWLSLGQRPGEKGSAVIAGHYGQDHGKPSVFDNLHKLHKGDIISVENDEGATISFVVRQIRRYDPKADASEVFVSNDGKSHLNLVTCEGVWNTLSQGYSKRLVVFADKKME